ncbi:MAG: TlyA family RNA methyltransferase [Ilumatobacteraceae bacterium]
MAQQRRRLDSELVRRGLVSSRTAAAEAISGGRVRVAGTIADKASRLVSPSESLSLEGPPARFVGRGGDKLLAAFEAHPFLADASRGARTIDCGSSTGGFTDCLLQHGAKSVLSVDVGRGQLHQRLLTDERVISLERTDIRQFAEQYEGELFDVLVADLSFISLTTVSKALITLCAARAPMVLLVKPQFEVGREIVSAGKGVVGRDEDRQLAIDRVRTTFEALGCDTIGVMDCPVHGADGNREFLLILRAPEGATVIS